MNDTYSTVIIKKQITFLLSVFSLLLILLFSFFSWKWADDFEMSNLINEYNGIFDYLITRYLTWDGRFASLNALLQTILMHYANVKLSIFIWGISFLGCAYVIHRIFVSSTSLEISSISKNYLSFSIVSATLWLSMFYILAQIIYWQTGGVYSFALLTGLLWVYLNFKIRTNSRVTHKILFFVFSIFAGTASHNLTTALLAFFVLTKFEDYIENKSISISLYGFIGVIIGSLVVFLSPGNFKRLSLYSNTVSYELIDMLYNYIYVLGRYIYFSLPVFLFAVISGISLSYISDNLFKKEKFSFIWLLKRLKWMLVALSTLLIFIAAPFLAEPRTSVFFMAFLYLFIAENTLYFYPYLKNKLKILSKLSGSTIVVSVFIIQTSVASYQLFKVYKIYPEIENRNKILELARNSNSDVVLEPINPAKIPFVMQFNDINENKDFWVNTQMAKYYGLNTVKLSYSINKK